MELPGVKQLEQDSCGQDSRALCPVLGHEHGLWLEEVTGNECSFAAFEGVLKSMTAGSLWQQVQNEKQFSNQKGARPWHTTGESGRSPYEHCM